MVELNIAEFSFLFYIYHVLKYNYFAVDTDGSCWAYTEKPYLDGDQYCCDAGNSFFHLFGNIHDLKFIVHINFNTGPIDLSKIEEHIKFYDYWDDDARAAIIGKE